MEKEELYFLVKQYRDGTISDPDLKKLKDYFRMEKSDSLLSSVLTELAEKDSLSWGKKEENDGLFESVQFKILAEEHRLRQAKVRTLNFLRVAAALFVLVGTAFLFFKTNWLKGTPNEPNSASQEWSAIVPGKSKAKIVLENGKEIDLEALANNESLTMDGYALVKNNKGEISYVLADRNSLCNDFYNTIIVPKGGEYKLNLPDGSQVWLNASSSLRYPINFGKESRKVELTGEAYFHVVKKSDGTRKLPFIVQTGEQELEVLGTQFNLNSYASKIKTTLVEGAVQLRFPNGRREDLSPNQQAIFSTYSGKVDVEKVNTYYTIAWKDGAFAFDNATLEEVLDCLSRWYDVSFEYERERKSLHFTGSISRYEKIEKLLDLIEMTNSVKFEIKGRRIMVTG